MATVSLAHKMLAAMTERRRGLRMAWLMGRASYAYTRSWDGAWLDGKLIRFGRWYAFKEALRCAWGYL